MGENPYENIKWTNALRPTRKTETALLLPTENLTEGIPCTGVEKNPGLSNQREPLHF